MTNRLNQWWDNYQLVHPLAQRGPAEMYVGKHGLSQELVVVNILCDLIEQSMQARFLSEARMISDMEHIHILKMVSFGLHGNTPFFITRYIPNGSLRQHHLKGERLPIETVVSYVQQIASALHYAHMYKIVHGNLTPENILIDSNGAILVSNFGMVLDAQYACVQDKKEIIAEAISYMAPEQMIGRPSSASDQYALGLLVYEWLSGEPPFQGTLPELYRKQRFASPPPFLERTPSLPMAVEGVVLKALAKDEKQRFESIEAFAIAIEQACSAEQLATPTLPLKAFLPSSATNTHAVNATAVAAESLTAFQTPPSLFDDMPSSVEEPIVTQHTKSLLQRPSRRTILLGLTCFGAGIGVSALVSLLSTSRGIALPSTTNIVASPSPTSPPFRFTELVVFRGDFGAKEVVNPKGLAYQPQSIQMIVSLSPYTPPNGQKVQILNHVDGNGDRVRFAANYQMYRDVESLLVVVPSSGPPVDAGFKPGEVFVGRGPGDEISRLLSSGVVLSEIWANPGTNAGLWGGLAFDTVGAFGGKLIAMTIKGKMFLIDAAGNHVLFKDVALAIGKGVEQRLEGIAIAPVGFGPHAGQLIVGVEGVDDNDPNSGKIYAISAGGEVTLLTTIGYAAECISFVPPNGGTYYQAELSFDREHRNRLLTVSASQFLNRLGHMIVVNEYTGQLWDVAWNGTGYTNTSVGFVPDDWSTQGTRAQGTELEAGCFAERPATLPKWSNWASVPGNFVTNHAPCVGVDANGNLHLLAIDATSHRIYISTMSGSNRTWDTWQEVAPGGLTSNYPLASVLHNRVLYAFAVLDDGTIMYKRLYIDSGHATTEPWQEVPGGVRTTAAVALTISRGRLALCVKGGDQTIYLNLLEPGARSWSGWSTVAGGERTDQGLALATFQEELYLITREKKTNAILVRAQSSNGTWSDWAQIPGKGKSDTSLSTAIVSEQLYLFAKTLAGEVAWNVASNTGTWSLWQAMPGNFDTDVALSSGVIIKRIYLVAKSSRDNQLYMRYTL